MCLGMGAYGRVAWVAVNAWLWAWLGRRRRFCWSGGVDGIGGLGWGDGVGGSGWGDGVGGSGWGDDVGDRVGAVRQGRVMGALGRRRHLGAGSTASSVRGPVLVDACCL